MNIVKRIKASIESKSTSRKLRLKLDQISAEATNLAAAIITADQIRALADAAVVTRREALKGNDVSLETYLVINATIGILKREGRG